MSDLLDRIATQLDGPPISRFAPSPTGYLHLGHLVNAVCTWGITRALGGKVILRLEDHDQGRCRPEYAAAILEDLEWLGLIPDLSTIDTFREGTTPYRQSDNTTAYENALQRLTEAGLVYGCACSRKEIVTRTTQTDGELRYDNHCRDRGTEPAPPNGTRMLLPDESVTFDDAALGTTTQTPQEQCGDLLLRDRHGNWTYQFAVTVDDLDQGINLVIRGEDLLDSTGRQILLAHALGRETPPVFAHHPLITDPDGKKLSKRDFAMSLRDHRAEGATAEQLLEKATKHAGIDWAQSPR